MTKTVTVDPEVAEKDTNGDGHISKQEMEMDLEFKRKELEDVDGVMGQMVVSLFGMLLYPFAVVLANLIGLETASKILGDGQHTLYQLQKMLWVSLVQTHTQIKRNRIKHGRDGQL